MEGRLFMSTTLKFNLMVDGQKVRTLEELRENFNLEDVLEHFYSGKLQKWLSSRDYQYELEQVKDIVSYDKIDVSSELLDIFDIKYNQKDLKDFIDELNQYEALAQEKVQKNSPNIFAIRKSNLSDNKDNGAYSEYQRLIDEICMHDHKVDLIKQKLEIILSKYYELYLKERLGLIARFTQEAPNALLAIIDSPKAFNPFLPALLKFNQIIKEPLSADESYELKALKNALDTLGEKHAFNYDKILDNFSNLTAENIVAQFDYFEYGLPCTIEFDQCMLIFSSQNIIELNEQRPYKEIPFTPLLMCNNNIAGEIVFEEEDDLVVTLDLIDYDISEEQWQLIAKRGLTLG